MQTGVEGRVVIGNTSNYGISPAIQELLTVDVAKRLICKQLPGVEIDVSGKINHLYHGLKDDQTSCFEPSINPFAGNEFSLLATPKGLFRPKARFPQITPSLSSERAGDSIVMSSVMSSVMLNYNTSCNMFKSYEFEATFSLELREINGIASLSDDSSIKITGKDALLAKTLLSVCADGICSDGFGLAEAGLKAAKLFRYLSSTDGMAIPKINLQSFSAAEKDYVKGLLTRAVSGGSKDVKEAYERMLNSPDSEVSQLMKPKWGGKAIAATLMIAGLSALCALIPPVGAVVVMGVGLSSPLGIAALAIVGGGLCALATGIGIGVKKLAENFSIRKWLSKDIASEAYSRVGSDGGSSNPSTNPLPEGAFFPVICSGLPSPQAIPSVDAVPEWK